MTGEPFIVKTHTQTVSQFGCSILLDFEVAVDQTLVLMNENTRQSVQCRVVSTRKHRDGKKHAGLEFISPSTNFWRMSFSKPGAKSLKRTYGVQRDTTAS